jgi:hypothetical protein
MPRGLMDAFMQRRGRTPRHCRACEKRFYLKVEEPAGTDKAG